MKAFLSVCVGLLCLAFVNSINVAYGLDHDEGILNKKRETRESVQKPNLEPTEETLLDLRKLIAVVDSSAGRLYWIREEAEYNEHRVRLRKKLAALGSLEALQKSFEKIEFPVWSEKENEYQTKILDAGMLVVLASSEASADGNRVSQVKENGDRVGKILFPTKLKDSVPKAQDFYQNLVKFSQERTLSYHLMEPQKTDRPDDFSIELDLDSKNVSRVSHEKAADAWDVEASLRKFRTNPEYSAWIRGKIANHERLDDIFQSNELKDLLKAHPVRPELEGVLTENLKAKVLLDAVSKDEIAKLLSLTRAGQGKISISPLDTVEAKKIREKLLSSPDSWKLFELIKSNSQESLNLGVVNTWNWNRIENTDVKGLGALLAIALSNPEKDLKGRQLLLVGKGNQIVAVPVVTSVPTVLPQTEVILEKYFQDEILSKDLSLMGNRKDNRPADFYHEWRVPSQRYERISNKDATNDWDAERDVQKIVAHSNLKPEMLQRFLEWRAKPQSGLNAEGVLKSAKVRERIALDVEQKDLVPLVEKKLGRFIESKWEELKDSSKNENVRVEKPNLGAYTSIIPSKDPAVTRIAILYPSGDIYGSWLNASHTAGAIPFSVYNTEQARLKIIEEYKKAGKPIDVIFGSHGNDSYMAYLLGSNEPDTLKLLRDTSGMIRNVYLMGCHVGRGADSNGNHLIRKFVGHGAESALGVDTYLYGGGNSNGRNEFFIKEGNGHLMTAKPNYQNHPWAQKAAVGN